MCRIIGDKGKALAHLIGDDRIGTGGLDRAGDGSKRGTQLIRGIDQLTGTGSLHKLQKLFLGVLIVRDAEANRPNSFGSFLGVADRGGKAFGIFVGVSVRHKNDISGTVRLIGSAACVENCRGLV